MARPRLAWPPRGPPPRRLPLLRQPHRRRPHPRRPHRTQRHCAPHWRRSPRRPRRRRARQGHPFARRHPLVSTFGIRWLPNGHTRNRRPRDRPRRPRARANRLRHLEVTSPIVLRPTCRGAYCEESFSADLWNSSFLSPPAKMVTVQNRRVQYALLSRRPAAFEVERSGMNRLVQGEPPVGRLQRQMKYIARSNSF